VPCDSHDDGLVEFKLVEIRPYLEGCLVAIDERHIAVHQNEGVLAYLAQVLLDILLDYVYCLLSSQSPGNYRLDVYATFVLKDYLKSIQVEALIINYQNFVLYRFVPS